MTQRLKNFNPLKLISEGSDYIYQRLPVESPNGSRSFTLQSMPWPSQRRAGGFFSARFSPTRLVWAAISALVLLFLLIGSYEHSSVEEEKDNGPVPFHWQEYYRLNGYYNGIRTLVTSADYTPENGYNRSIPAALTQPVPKKLNKMPPLNPKPYDPYGFDSPEYLKTHRKVETCFLDEKETVPAPNIYAYPGVPQNMTEPFFGSYENLGLNGQVCFDRFSRFAPYGYGVPMDQGGLGPGNKSEKTGAEKVFYQAGTPDYKDIDWGSLQERCYEKNRLRFISDTPEKPRVQRHAYILRIWEDFYFNEHYMYTLRAMINELSLKSGGEYDVHFLLHAKTTAVPIWADQETYAQYIRDNMPQEFWNMTTLWSETQFFSYYPEPWVENFENPAGSGIYGVYRSPHFALQWFAQQRPEYDFYWNWEMDMRYTGHYYEFNNRISEWTKKQPRKGLWERNERFYIPKYHGTWDNFTETIEAETKALNRTPIWGPVSFNNSGALNVSAEHFNTTSYEDDKYEWGVGEDADYISFNPIFDPARTNWVFRNDITGYNTTMEKPPRRCSIITVSRLSKRLLDIMHKETWKMRHSMFAEMWPVTVALHHGLKAVYAPHPVYFDRDWDLQYMDDVFNHPKEEWESPFGWGEHNLLGSSFYYNSGFAGALWRRWLGMAENNEGGHGAEDGGSGRMCLRSTLQHPIKHELGIVD